MNILSLSTSNLLPQVSLEEELEIANYEILKAGREAQISYLCILFSPNNSTGLTLLNSFRLPIIEVSLAFWLEENARH